MEKENQVEAFWYRIKIERCDSKGYETKTRFELLMRFEPQYMYELIREIVNFSVSDTNWKASPKEVNRDEITKEE